MDSESRDKAINLALFAASLVLMEENISEKLILEMKENGVEREEIREAILQTYLFDGYPTALEGMILLSETWPGKPEPIEYGKFEYWETWEARGKELYGKIYGDVADKLQNRALEISPELSRWMIIEGYGKVLSRGKLDIATREIIIVAVLVTKKRKRQLHSHIRGALRVGAITSDLEHLLEKLSETFKMSFIEQARDILFSVSETNSSK